MVIPTVTGFNVLSVSHAHITPKDRPRAHFARRGVALLTVALLAQTACVKGGMAQLASPAALQDMHTILRDLDLPHQLGSLVQEVLDVGRKNLDDDAWDALLQETAVAVVAEAMPIARGDIGDPSRTLQRHLIDVVRDRLRHLAAEPGPHDPTDTADALAKAIVDALGPSVSPDRRADLIAEIARGHSSTLDGAVAGPDPFTRLLGRNLALGFMDGINAYDPEPIHRFLATERTAFAVGAQASLAWWKISFWVAAGAAGVALIGISVQLWRDVHMRRRNTKTLRLLAGALKAREADPALRDILATIADPSDPDAALHLREFYDQHPDLRLNLRKDPPRHEVAPQEST